jgi:thiol:disulfide interchange protein DsbD
MRPAAAHNRVRTGHVEARLLGPQMLHGRVYAGVALSPEPGWHLYGQNPGDSGQAPQVHAGPTSEGPWAEVLWPLAERLTTPPLASYGYPGALVLPLRLDAQASAELPELWAEVQWLACAERCVPGRATLRWTPADAGQGDAQALADALAAVPQPLPSHVRAQASLSGRRAVLALQNLTDAPIAALQFLPDADVGVDENVAQHWGQDGNRLTLSFTAANKAAPLRLTGTLAVTQKGRRSGVALSVPWSAEPTMPATPRGVFAAQGAPDAATSPQHLAAARLQAAAVAAPQTPTALGLRPLAVAFCGGMLLNFMPCVFPVLSMKLVALWQLGATCRRRQRQHAWLYALGNLLSFVGLGAVLLALRYGGHQLGWGFQLQSPTFVMGLVLLLFVVGLMQMGMLQVGRSVMGVGQSLAQRAGGWGAFFSGIFAVVVATPCSAPWVGAATGAALAASPPAAMALFAAMGAGLATPFLVGCHVAGAANWLPRPGAWMAQLRQASGLAMWGTALWLAWILGQQLGVAAVVGAQAACLGIGCAAWCLHHWPQRRWAQGAALLLCGASLTVGWVASRSSAGQRWEAPAAGPRPVQPDPAAHADTDWQPWSPDAVAALRAQGRPVFVNFTASWCVTCQINAALVLNTPAAQAGWANKHVARLRADWTQQDPRIADALAEFGRSSVPLYVLYPPSPAQPPQVLPGMLTPEVLRKALLQLP